MTKMEEGGKSVVVDNKDKERVVLWVQQCYETNQRLPPPASRAAGGGKLFTHFCSVFKIRWLGVNLLGPGWTRMLTSHTLNRWTSGSVHITCCLRLNAWTHFPYDLALTLTGDVSCLGSTATYFTAYCVLWYVQHVP